MLAFGTGSMQRLALSHERFSPCSPPPSARILRSCRLQTRAAAPGENGQSRVPGILSPSSGNGVQPSSTSSSDTPALRSTEELNDRIGSGQYTVSPSPLAAAVEITRPLRQWLAADPTGLGRRIALPLAKSSWRLRTEASRSMPVATGDVREIVDQPVFIPLYKLFLVYGKIFRLSFGPKSFVIISDPAYAKQILLTNADNYSKGILSEILEFVMGTGLIPADGELWKIRRRAIVPALHKKYVASMVTMFGQCTLHGVAQTLVPLAAAGPGKSVDMENFFSRLALDIIGKAVFNYNFDSLTHDDPVIQAVYTVMREAEHRSTAPIPYWNLPGAAMVVPRQRRCQEALLVVNSTLDVLIAKSKKLMEEEDEEFVEEFLSAADPSILHFLLASGDKISSKQLRDDLMTMLIAGHETTAAVLTWTFHLLAQNPHAVDKIRAEVDTVLGDGVPGLEEMRGLRYTTRVINEAMRLYPQPPVLIRRALEEDSFDGVRVEKGSDLFISVWNIHHGAEYWEDPDQFRPERFPLDQPIPTEVTTNFAFLPFGGGRRKCIGDQFALFESIVALSMLVRRYDFAMAPDAPAVAMTTGATIHTVAGLFMTVTARDMTGVAAGPANGTSVASNAAASNGAANLVEREAMVAAVAGMAK